MTPSRSPSDDVPRKATLHCMVCGHASPPAGDWREALVPTDAGERLSLSCPECGTMVTRRFVRDEESRPQTAV